MLRSKRLPFTVAIALLAGSLAGCQVIIPNASPFEPAPAAPLEISQGNPTQGSDPLNLTAEQRQQIEAINQSSLQGDSSAGLQRLLVAPTLDVSALRAQLAQSDGDIDKAVDAQLRFRNILTPQQRTTLIAAFQQTPQSSDGSSGQSQMQAMQQQLNLTPEQTRALTAMTTALQQHERANQSRIQQAHISLISTGDATAYRQALAEANLSMPLDAVVAFYTSLSQAQRQSLFTPPSNSGSGS
jgi:Spy/CpxP family protein refolding chaperone